MINWSLEDLDAMARTVFGEARGEGWQGQLAVGWVIRNRAKIGGWFGSSIYQVCHKPLQFSCWNDSDPNRSLIAGIKLETDRYFREAFAAASVILTDARHDLTNGATHYHSRAVAPAWSKELSKVAEVGDHFFYRKD